MEFHIPFNTYLDQHRTKSLALYHALRDAILSGTLPDGTRLPASRELAALYQLSRGLVTQVYEMLAAEGYLNSAVGRGTFVSFSPHGRPVPPTDEPLVPPLSKWGQHLDRALNLPPAPAVEYRWDFSISTTSLEAFPVADWNRTFYRTVREMLGHDRADTYNTQGHLALRESIAQYLRRARGIDATADHVILVNGSAQAITLLAQLLIDPGEPVVIEDPCYRGTRQAVETFGGRLLPSPVDEQGILVDDWPARLLFVTPSRQFPTGAVLSLKRRQELLHWAARRNAVIVEDDYDSEFRHGGRPIEPLKALDTADRVVYIGTFSKTLFKNIRLGYAVVPNWLRDPFLKARHLYEPQQTSILQQRALADFMNGGHYERHLRRMKRIYSQKHKLCDRELRAQLGQAFDFVESDAGLHICGWWKGSDEDYIAFRRACLQHGVRFVEAAPYWIAGNKKGALFGFAHLTEDEIRTGIARMAELLK